MEPWLVWLILAAALGVGELIVRTASLATIAVAALLTAGVAVLKAPLPIQVLVFIIAAVLGALARRPLVRRHMASAREQRIGIEAIRGRSAYVSAAVTAKTGRIQVDGEEWAARSFDESLTIPTGTLVDVLEITDDATALVYPLEHL
jgi:membrane protein implicated in regulation of membrane protease activity